MTTTRRNDDKDNNEVNYENINEDNYERVNRFLNDIQQKSVGSQKKNKGMHQGTGSSN